MSRRRRRPAKLPGPCRVVLVHWNQPERLAATVAALPRLGLGRRRRPHHRRGQRFDAGGQSRHRGHRRHRVRSSTPAATSASARGQRRVPPVPGRPPTATGSPSPHDALPAPDCLARILGEVTAGPRPAWPAPTGDGATPVVDPYFGGIPAPATVTEGWEPAGYPTAPAWSPSATAWPTSASSTSATSPTARRPSSACGRSRGGWDVGLHPGRHGAQPAAPRRPAGGLVPPAAQHRCCWSGRPRVATTPSSGSSSPRSSSAVGLVAPSRRGPVLARRGKVRGMVDFLQGPLRPAAADAAGPHTPPRDRRGRSDRLKRSIRRSDQPARWTDRSESSNRAKRFATDQVVPAPAPDKYLRAPSWLPRPAPLRRAGRLAFLDAARGSRRPGRGRRSHRRARLPGLLPLVDRLVLAGPGRGVRLLPGLRLRRSRSASSAPAACRTSPSAGSPASTRCTGPASGWPWP